MAQAVQKDYAGKSVPEHEEKLFTYLRKYIAPADVHNLMGALREFVKGEKR